MLDARPPTTTVAKGRCTSDPTPVDSSMGMSPKAAMAAVISTGRRRDNAPKNMASAWFRPESM